MSFLFSPLNSLLYPQHLAKGQAKTCCVNADPLALRLSPSLK